MVAVLALVGATLVGRRWHVQASRIVDAEPESAWATLLVPLVGGAVFVLLVALGRAIGALYGRVSTWLARRMGERAARATGLLALVSVTVLLASGVLWDASMRFADRVYATLDGSTPDGATQPSTGLRSGGPGSLVEWDSLGREGRSFTGRGPDQCGDLCLPRRGAGAGPDPDLRRAVVGRRHRAARRPGCPGPVAGGRLRA